MLRLVITFNTRPAINKEKRLLLSLQQTLQTYFHINMNNRASKKKSKVQLEPKYPPFVKHGASDEGWDSDAEEFNTLNHYVEVTENDMERSPEVSLSSVDSLNNWFMTKLYADLERAEQSECYKRCTMWKLTRRFLRLKHVDSRFFNIINEACFYLEGESLGGWLKRCSFTHHEEFLNLSVLHYIHCLFKKGLDLNRGSLPMQVMALYEECVQALPKLADVHILNLVGKELTNFEQDGKLSDFVQEQLTNAFRMFLKPLYRFKLLHHLSCEKDHRKYIVLVKYGYKRKQVFNYFGTPNYFRKPVKGPFRPTTAVGSKRSTLLRLYGTEPNPEYFYCECRRSENLCGHMPLRVGEKGRLEVAHDFCFRHKF